MRLFFAIPVPTEHRRTLLSVFPPAHYPGIRFTIPEQLHITLHFLGETEKGKLPSIISAANRVAATYMAFELKFRSFKVIQKQHKPVMIWAQGEQDEAFEALCMQFRNALPTGENKKPDPHITIARIKQLKQLPFELPQLKPFSFKAERIELFESVTDPAGAVYKLVEKWELK